MAAFKKSRVKRLHALARFCRILLDLYKDCRLNNVPEGVYMKILKFLIIYLLVFVSLANAGNLEELVVLHTNDLHGHYYRDEIRGRGGLAAISGYAKKIRKDDTSVLLLDAGDAVSGTPECFVSKGIGSFELMSLMGYDAGILGNHEKDYGLKQIKNFKKAADFPLLCANWYSNDDRLVADKPFILKKIGKLTVGIAGIRFTRSNAKWRLMDPVSTLKSLVPKIKKQCDLLIVIAHNPLEEDIKIARKIPGIDILISGHDHMKIMAKKHIPGTRTFLAQAGQYGKYLGRIDILYDQDAKKIHSLKSRLIPTKQIKDLDLKLATALAKFRKDTLLQIPNLLEVMGDCPWFMDRDEELLNLVEKIFKIAAGTDFGYIIAHGSIRDHFYPGQLTYRDVCISFPFRNQFLTLEVKGKNITGILKQRIQARGKTIDPS
ncbi:MAG: bifunctional metallophosphatase/5'-nucleotidase, partial [Desulfobacteraceae bacterium]|nr:bifunctional metallophosphatase/5'-nucleotidase [Desulfobacteraceae bacterium]